MVEYVLENNILKVTVDSKGCEIRDVICKTDNTHRMWNANPEGWKRVAPVLFPLIGKYKDNQSIYNGKVYEMGQHGFARDMEFTLVKHNDDMLVMRLESDENTKEKYPFDTIDEVKKGARGADCMQIVHTRESQNCGKIYYESKRTKDFQKSWIEKFKADMREKGADIGVLVTDVMPSDMQRMGLYEGIWICSFEEFKGISAVLREQIIKIHHAMKSQENKTDKMSLLYGFLTSNEFKMQIEAIVEAFTTMQSDLDSEKRSMQRIWKQREKQIEKVLDNTINMYGSIRGIAGNAIGNIKALELGYSGDVIDGDGNEEL